MFLRYRVDIWNQKSHILDNQKIYIYIAGIYTPKPGYLKNYEVILPAIS